MATDPPVPATIYIDSSPRNDCGLRTDLPAGTFELFFGTVPGFVAPTCEIANLTPGMTTNLTATYTRAP